MASAAWRSLPITLPGRSSTAGRPGDGLSRLEVASRGSSEAQASPEPGGGLRHLQRRRTFVARQKGRPWQEGFQ